MPGLKSVPSLGHLSVDKLTVLLADIVNLLPNESGKTNGVKEKRSDIPSVRLHLGYEANGTQAVKVMHLDNDTRNVSNKELLKKSDSDEISEDKKLELSDEKENLEEVLESEKIINDPEKEKKMLQQKQEIEKLYKDLSSILTGHSHVTLHDLLFSSTCIKLNGIYNNNKLARPAIMDIIPLFINSSLRELDFERFKMLSDTAMCKVLFNRLDRATKLENLSIGRSCFWRSDIFSTLANKIKVMPNLTSLKIQYICTVDMIQNLSDYCPNLVQLNLKGSEKINDEAVGEISKCSELECLDISGTRITGRGCWTIVDSCSKLSWLQHCAFNCCSDSLIFDSRTELIDRIKDQIKNGETNVSLVNKKDIDERNKTFNLRMFWLFNPRTEEILVSLLCPNLTHLKLDFVYQDLPEEPDVSVLACLPHLRTLTLSVYDRVPIQMLQQMLESCGSQLTTLKLHLVNDWFNVVPVHNLIATSCPNLITLAMSGDYKALNSIEDSDEQLDFNLPAPALPHLENLTISGVVSNSRLRHVLLHSPNIKNIKLDGQLEWLHDATFTSLLQVNHLSKLEELYFNVSTTVTLSTVRQLLQCENNLKLVGRLCHMGGATMEQYQDLQSVVRQHNLDTQLIWVTDERNSRFCCRDSSNS